MEIKIQGIPIYYEIHGKGKPIVMIHGFFVDHRLMSGCMEPLFDETSEWMRIYLDLPGMGKTPAPDWLESSEQMLEIVNEFIKKVIPGKSFAIAGESYGGYLTQGLLHKNIKRINGAMLLCSMMTGYAENRILPEQTSFVRDELLLESLSKEDRDGFETFCVMLTPYVWEKMRDDILSGIKIADQDFLQKLSQGKYPFSFEQDLVNTKFEKPMLILTGKQDTAVGYTSQISLLKQYPHATYLALDRAGHNLQIEQPQVFRSLTCEWLRSMQETWS